MVQLKEKSPPSKAKQTSKKSTPEISQSKNPSTFGDLDRFFDDYLNRNWLGLYRSSFPKLEDLWGTYEMHSPNMDIIDRGNEVVVRAELPGVEKDDVDITVSKNVLSIKGTSCKESSKEKGDYYRSECKKGSFARSIGLPADVDTSKIKASFNNGLLELKISKFAKSKQKKININ